MKKGGILALLCLTLAFVGFAFGMLVGRNIEKEPVTIGISTKPEPATGQPVHNAQETVAAMRININTASAQILDALPGIGHVLAQRIIDYRQKNGPFMEVAELSKVEGIGSKKLLALLDYITVED